MKFWCPECRDKWEDRDDEGSLYQGLELTCPMCESIWEVDYSKIEGSTKYPHGERPPLEPPTRLEVRCCCAPEKLLGWLPVHDHSRGLPSAVSYPARPAVGEKYSVVRLPLAEVRVGTNRYMALKADGVPIETLRRIPSFEEAR